MLIWGKRHIFIFVCTQNIQNKWQVVTTHTETHTLTPIHVRSTHVRIIISANNELLPVIYMIFKFTNIVAIL